MNLQSELTFLIVLETPPSGVDFALQKGHGSTYETIQKQRSTGADLRFEFNATLRTAKDGTPDFAGPFVQGPPNGRFVYIDIGTCAGQLDSKWSRRLKIPLAGISLPATKGAGADRITMITSVPGTGKDGGPNCATVKPFAGWTTKSL